MRAAPVTRHPMDIFATRGGDQGPPGSQGPPGTGLEIKGSVPAVDDLPETAEPGDVWVVTSYDPDHLFMWNGDSWVDLGEGGGSFDEFDTVAAMLATGDGARGTGVVWKADGFRYREADPAATDHHLTTASGVKLYVQPSEDGWYNFLAMGPARDSVTDDYPKLKKLLDIRPQPPGASASWPMGPSIYFPHGSYYMEPGINGIQIKACTHLRGSGPTMSNSYKHSELRFPANSVGLCFNFYDTLNGVQEIPSTGGALGSSVRQMVIRSGSGVAPSINSDTAHGIECRVMMSIEDVQVFHFSGDGIRLYGSAASHKGNANLFRLSNCWVYGCRHGVFVDGPDGNAGMGQQINCSGNRRWGIYDSGFLGNTWIGCHTDSNGVATAGGNPADSSSVVWAPWTLNAGATTGSIDAGSTKLTVNTTTGLFTGAALTIAGVTGTKSVSSIYRNVVTLAGGGVDATVVNATVDYAPALFKPASASVSEADLVATVPGTASIPGDLATTVWEYWRAGQVHSYYPAWTPGKPVGTYFVGGGYRVDNLNARSVFLGCYQEENGGGNSFVGPTMVLGGLIGGDEMDGGAFIGGGGNTLISSGGSYKVQDRSISTISLGGEDSLGTILSWTHSEDTPSTPWRFRRTLTNDFGFEHAAIAGRTPFKMTSEQTTEKMGTGAGIPFVGVLPTLAFGASINVRRHTTASAAPTTGSYAVGDTIWNVAPGVGGSSGWRCTTAGTFGTLNGGATTGDITSGTTTLTVNSATGLAVGNAITIAGVTGTKWVTEVVGTTITIDTAASATVTGAAVAYATPVVTRFGEQVAQQTIATDAAFTLTPITSPRETRHTGTLTADRAYTLSTTNAYAGLRLRISRSGGGAFNLTNALKNIGTGQWAEFVFDGSAWYVGAAGAL